MHEKCAIFHSEVKKFSGRGTALSQTLWRGKGETPPDTPLLSASVGPQSSRLWHSTTPPQHDVPNPPLNRRGITTGVRYVSTSRHCEQAGVETLSIDN